MVVFRTMLFSKSANLDQCYRDKVTFLSMSASKCHLSTHVCRKGYNLIHVVYKQLACFIHGVVHHINYPCFDVIHPWTYGETSECIYRKNIEHGYLRSNSWTRWLCTCCRAQVSTDSEHRSPVHAWVCSPNQPLSWAVVISSDHEF